MYIRLDYFYFSAFNILWEKNIVGQEKMSKFQKKY